jgi:glycerophosphoryl diester phosphodiesterase
MAHRGGASDAPENTMAAFERAVGLGYRYLETDTQVTADGVLLAFHDDDLQRTCNRPGTISSLPYSEVATARVGGSEPIPRLEDLLTAWPDARFNVDCKSDAAVEPLVALVRRLGCVDRVCIGSFSDGRIGRIRRGLGDAACTSLAKIETAFIKLVPWPLYLPGYLGSGLAAQVPVTRGRFTVTTRRFVARAHHQGLGVHVWTIDDRDEMVRLLDIGVDGIITDRPAVLKDVLVERGQWHE